VTKLLMKICLPKDRSATDPKTRSAAGKLSGIVGIGCNVLLFGLKFLIGTVSGAVSIVADAMNNLTDAGSAVVTLIGFRLAEKPADEDHPYGHARYEYLSGLAVAVMIILIGFELAKTSVGKIINPQAVSLSLPMFLALGGSVVVKLWLSLFNTRLGKHIDSAALLATAADSRNDCVSTLAVVAAALAERLTNWHLDGFVGLGVAGFILYSGAKAVKETISPLLGESASPQLQRDIIALLKEEPAVLDDADLADLEGLDDADLAGLEDLSDEDLLELDDLDDTDLAELEELGLAEPEEKEESLMPAGILKLLRPREAKADDVPEDVLPLEDDVPADMDLPRWYMAQ